MRRQCDQEERRPPRRASARQPVCALRYDHVTGEAVGPSDTDFAVKHRDQVALILVCSIIVTDLRLARDVLPSNKTQALVNVKAMKWNVAKQLEPMFLSLAIFDDAKKERVTESVHIVSINPDEVNHMLGARYYTIAKELLGSKVLFQLDDLSPDLFLVIYLEKTLRAADVDHAVDEWQKVMLLLLLLLLCCCCCCCLNATVAIWRVCINLCSWVLADTLLLPCRSSLQCNEALSPAPVLLRCTFALH